MSSPSIPNIPIQPYQPPPVTPGGTPPVAATPIAVITAIADIISIASQILQGVKAGQDALAIAGSVVFHSKALQDLVGRVAPTVTSFLGDHVGTHKETLAAFGDILTNHVADQLLEGTDAVAEGTHLSPLKSLAAHFKQREASYTEDVFAIAGTTSNYPKIFEAGLSELIAKGLGLFKESIEDHADLLPEGVNQVAGAAIMRTIEMSLAAHIAASTTAILIPGHTVNLTQMLLGFADLIGIGGIGEKAVGPTLEHGLKVPADHQARKLFRTQLPDPESVRSRYAKRQVTRDDYVRVLELNGLQDDWIKIQADHPWHIPRPRELLQLIQDVEVDIEWVARQLRLMEWPDEMILRGSEAIMKRLRKPGHDKYLAELLTSFIDGYMSQDRFEAELKQLIGDDAHRSYYVGAASWGRGRNVASRLATAISAQARSGVISDDAAKEMLTGIGLAPGEVQVRIALAALARNEKHLKDEDVQIERDLRALKSESLKTLQHALTRGLIDEATFATYAQTLGYSESYAGALAHLGALERASTVKTQPYTHGLIDATTAPAPLELALPVPGAPPLEAKLVELRAKIATTPTADKPPLRAQAITLAGQVAVQRATDKAVADQYKTVTGAILKNLRAHLRRDVLSRDSFLALATTLGVDPLYAGQLADIEVLKSQQHLAGIPADDIAAAIAAAHTGITELMTDLVSTREVAGAAALKILADAGVPGAAAQLAIILAELLAQSLDNQLKLPFAQLDASNLVGATVLNQVLTRLADGFGSDTAIGKMLAGLGLTRPDEQAISSIISAVENLVGAFQKRTRDPVTVPRQPDPPPVNIPQPPPDEHQVAQIKGDIASLLSSLTTCRTAVKGLGAAADSYPAPDLSALDGTDVVALGALRDAIALEVSNCDIDLAARQGTIPTDNGQPQGSAPAG